MSVSPSLLVFWTPTVLSMLSTFGVQPQFTWVFSLFSVLLRVLVSDWFTPQFQLLLFLIMTRITVITTMAWPGARWQLTLSHRSVRAQTEFATSSHLFVWMKVCDLGHLVSCLSLLGLWWLSASPYSYSRLRVTQHPTVKFRGFAYCWVSRKLNLLDGSRFDLQKTKHKAPSRFKVAEPYYVSGAWKVFSCQFMPGGAFKCWLLVKVLLAAHSFCQKVLPEWWHYYSNSEKQAGRHFLGHLTKKNKRESRKTEVERSCHCSSCTRYATYRRRKKGRKAMVSLNVKKVTVLL